MAQTKLGALKLSARRHGIPFAEFKVKVEAGFKYCHGCHIWKPVKKYHKSKNRGDGLNPQCKLCCQPADIRGMTKSESLKLRAAERQAAGYISPKKGKPNPDKGASQRMKEMWAKRKASGWVNPKKGVPRSLETRAKISASHRASEVKPRGPEHHFYRDNKLSERRGIRHSTEYKQWRKDVFFRDKFTCQHCGDNKGGNLVAHHIKPFADFPKLRLEAENGLTLCTDCHHIIH